MRLSRSIQILLLFFILVACNDSSVSNESPAKTEYSPLWLNEVWLTTFPFDYVNYSDANIKESGLTKKIFKTIIESKLAEVEIKVVPTANTDMIASLWVYELKDSQLLEYQLNLKLQGDPITGERTIIWIKNINGIIEKNHLKDETIQSLNEILDQFIADYLKEKQKLHFN